MRPGGTWRRESSRDYWRLAVWCAGFSVAAWCSTSLANTVDSNLWGTDGTVTATARLGNTLYVGGAFTSVGPNTGGGVPVDQKSGAVVLPFPKVAGVVATVVSDGDGGWYIGGQFSSVGGLPRSNLAHVLSDGSVASWNPGTMDLSPGRYRPFVHAIAIHDNTVYVGGAFSAVDGHARSNLAALDAATGAVKSWDPRPDSYVETIVSSEGTLYVGGDFTRVGNQDRRALAAFSPASGQLLQWNPRAAFFGQGHVYVLAVHGHFVFVGGVFDSLGGQERAGLGAVDAMTGRASAWSAGIGGPAGNPYFGSPSVSALAVHGGTLYVAGHFTAIGGHTRGSLAAVDLRSGDVTPWNPLPDSIPPDVSALAVNGHTIVVGGGFTVIGGQPRSHVAALDAESGTATAWNPETNGPVLVIACSGVVVYLGGAFTGVGTWQRRNGLAAMDLTTGMVTQWNPQPDGFIVLALAAGSGRVYVGGDFRMIGGQVRAGLAALDTLTGVAVDWNPQANSYVDAIVLQDQTVYVGGNFTRIGGQSRNYLAALDASTGAATPWNPGANGRVFTLAHGGDTLYAGGYFTSVGGQPRSFLAAIDAASGSVTDWNPSADEWVNALAISGHVVYAGGAFQAVGGQSRNAVAALDLTSGEALAWNPDLAGAHGGYYPEVYALAVADGRVYVGGDFATVGGRPRDYFAELNGNTAAVTDWDPSADGVVWSVMADGNSVYVGGRFTSLGGLPCAGLAAVAVSDRPFAYVARQLAREPLLLAQNAPNPVRTRSLIRFAVPSAGPVTLSVFDLQGRRMATLFDHQQLAAGQHEAALRTEGWPAGWYVYRLDAGQITATRTMLVVR